MSSVVTDESVQDAATRQERRERLTAAMDTRAAKWCRERTQHLLDRDLAEDRPATPLSTLAVQLSAVHAAQVVRRVYVLGADPQDAWVVEDAWQHRVLYAWSRLVHLVDYDWYRDDPVLDTYLEFVATIEAGDAAITWWLAPERAERRVSGS